MSIQMPKPEQVFYNNIRSLIINLLIINKNLSNEYFALQTKHAFKKDMVERANYILERMEALNHLIGLDEKGEVMANEKGVKGSLISNPTAHIELDMTMEEVSALEEYMSEHTGPPAPTIYKELIAVLRNLKDGKISTKMYTSR